jgi:hypothetical protein
MRVHQSKKLLHTWKQSPESKDNSFSGRKTFVIYSLDKVLIFTIYKELQAECIWLIPIILDTWEDCGSISGQTEQKKTKKQFVRPHLCGKQLSVVVHD